MESINERIMPHASLQLDTGDHVVSGYFGGWVILNKDEYRAFTTQRWSKGDVLHKKLMEASIVVNETNMANVVGNYAKLNKNLYMRPALHIINATNVCNQRCTYCHAGVSQGNEKMNEEVAAKTIKFISENSDHNVHVEFQGGECLLNWPVVKLITEKLRYLNKSMKKNMIITVVTNLSMMDQEKLDFLLDHDVGICTSLDGPRDVHNHYRKRIGGQGSYDTTVEKIKWIKEEQKKRGKLEFVGMLATIGKHHLGHVKEIIDEYVRLGMNSIHLRPLNSLGDALSSWDDLSYDAETFMEFWKEGMEYIFELNKKGIPIHERGAHIKLRKLLAKQDALYVDMVSPSASGRGVIVYNFDGDLYTCDEGRMYKDDTFKIGNLDMDPKDIFGNDDLISMWGSTFLDLTCYHCAFRAYCGTSPVMNYQQHKNPIPNITQTFWHKVNYAQFKYLFEHLAQEGPEKETYLNWISQGMWV